MAQIWVAVHSSLTKLVRWNHVRVDSAAADVVAIAVETGVVAVDSAEAVEAIAVVSVAVVTAAETVGNS